MDISVAAVRLAFLALPGLIAAQVYHKLRGRRQKEPWETFSEVLLYSISSYTIWILIAMGWSHLSEVKNWRPTFLSVATRPGNQVATPLATAIFDEKSSPEWPELIARTIAPSCIIAFALALLASFLHNHRVLNRFGGKLGVTKRIGDEDLWDHLFTSDLTDEWIFVRDHKLNLVYFAHPALYSESLMQRELVLTDVSVYNNADTSRPLYDTRAMYLSRQSDDLTIEVPSLPPKETTHVTRSSTLEGRSPNDRREQREEGRSEARGDNPEA